MVERRRTSGARSSATSNIDESDIADEREEKSHTGAIFMRRSVSQLLFHYLPERTVDWENGLAIVKLTQAHLSSVWPDDKIATVLDEVALLFDHWRKRGGSIDYSFPDPRTRRQGFAIGTPISIEARALETAFICQHCSRLYFPKLRSLTRDISDVLVCSDCDKRALRQFGQVFVHGCGELVPVTEWMPATPRQEDGSYKSTSYPLKCKNCGDKGKLALPERGGRVKDMKLICRKCGSIVQERFTANCKRCLERIIKEQQKTASGGANASGETGESPQTTGSVVSRVAMRMARYSASDTYYPQTLTMLRLDRPRITRSGDEEIDLLRRMLPATRRPEAHGGAGITIEALGRRLKDAEANNNQDEIERIRMLIIQAISKPN
jgi:hypothetical protein